MTSFLLKLIKKYPERFIIIILLLIIFFMHFNKNNYVPIHKLPKIGIHIEKEYVPQPISIKNQSIKIDSIPYAVNIYHKGKIQVDTIKIYYKGKIKVDTIKIIKDYIAKIYYSDTLMNNDTAFILVKDTLQFNRIINRQKVIKIATIYNTKLKNHLFAGIGIMGNANQFRFSGELLLKNKRGNIYGLSYYPIDKIIGVSLFWKIK